MLHLPDLKPDAMAQRDAITARLHALDDASCPEQVAAVVRFCPNSGVRVVPCGSGTVR